MPHYVWADAAKQLPRVTVLGSLLAGSELQVGDELLWVNEVECRGPATQCAKSLAEAKAGEVHILARRPRAVVMADVVQAAGAAPPPGAPPMVVADAQPIN